MHLENHQVNELAALGAEVERVRVEAHPLAQDRRPRALGQALGVERPAPRNGRSERPLRC